MTGFDGVSGTGGGRGEVRRRRRGRKGEEKGRREEELYIFLACLPRLSVRSFRFGYGYAPDGGYIGRESQGEPFSIQSVKSTSKSHTVFHRRGRSRRWDRASFVLIAPGLGVHVTV